MDNWMKQKGERFFWAAGDFLGFQFFLTKDKNVDKHLEVEFSYSWKTEKKQ